MLGYEDFNSSQQNSLISVTKNRGKNPFFDPKKKKRSLFEKQRIQTQKPVVKNKQKIWQNLSLVQHKIPCKQTDENPRNRRMEKMMSSHQNKRKMQKRGTKKQIQEMDSTLHLKTKPPEQKPYHPHEIKAQRTESQLPNRVSELQSY